MTSETIVIATAKSWNIRRAEDLQQRYAQERRVVLITDKRELTAEWLRQIDPRYIFFPHWSWMIPAEVYQHYTCIVFHMTDLPFGRGGSPLQNLIARKIYDTKISAIAVEGEVDAGKIYMKEDFSVASGSAQEILERASEIIFTRMIPFLLERQITPQAQSGPVVHFSRRKPHESDLLQAPHARLDDLYDFIRMLDGEGYPPAFLRLGRLQITLHDVQRCGDKLVGSFAAIEENEE